MKYHLHQNILHISAESAQESLNLLSHFKLLNPISLLIQQGTPESKETAAAEWLKHVAEKVQEAIAGNCSYAFAGNAKIKWFEVKASLPISVLQPYLDLLKKITGYSGEIPEFEFSYPSYGLLHTHIVSKCLVSSAGIQLAGFMRSEDWNGKSAEERATPSFVDYTFEAFGYRPFEPEFLAKDNGCYQRNPKYATVRHSAKTGLGMPELWEALFSWWRQTHATVEQQAILLLGEVETARFNLGDNAWDIRKGGGHAANLVSYTGITTSYTENNVRTVTWDEFKALGQNNPAAPSEISA